MNPLEHWKSILAGAAGGGLVLALVIGGLSSGSENTTVAQEQPEETTEVETETEETEELEEQPAEPEAPLCSLEEIENDPRILQLQAAVINPETNELIYDVGADVPSRTASVMKLLTAAAALETLGPNYRVETRVYADKNDPTKIYLVGAGDVTLSRTAPGQQSIYRDAPKLSSLAFQVNQYVSTMEPPQAEAEPEIDNPNQPSVEPDPAPFTQEVTEIVLDSSLWGGAEGSGQWEKNWNPEGLVDGWMSQASALQVDGDRNQPSQLTSVRSEAPVERAGQWFRDAIGDNAQNATLSYGTAPADAVEIASVLSEPIKEWIRIMLLRSDNTVAEALARLVAYDVGLDGSDFESLTAAYKSALGNTGLNTQELVIEDGSGLSAYSSVSPKFVAELMELVVEGYPNFENILNSLPVAGESGSLENRFDDELSAAAGKILAKTGWIRTGYSLAGSMTAKDGTDLVFAVYNLGDVSTANREALDEFVYGIYDCGADLGN
jgi:D-alanyl-D-alanine carboxypeptidase/D-alanyl-D-alanine-endopeptidase (penicillin-binding protein 4)